jgi:L-histidine N-alpha-methyltransferase
VNHAFARDVLEGLTQSPKKLPSKYFYDESGDRLFQDIMQMPEYYLTGAELEIFERQKQAILRKINGAPFDLIELGAGDGSKTKVLIGYFLEQGADFQYCAVDISSYVLKQLEKDFKETWPALSYQNRQGDYFEVMEEVNKKTGRKKVILFLGANIGNLRMDLAHSFVERIGGNMRQGDLLLVGFDLKKDPQVILDAYNDPAGITEAFNLNLLRRINRELGGHFKLDAFKHWESYNPATGEAKSYLVSKRAQTVGIDALDRDFSFDAWEAIDVELSLKYSLPEIESMARDTGFEIAAHFFDRRSYFVDSLWRRMAHSRLH